MENVWAWMQRVEPAMVRGVISALVGLGLIWGIDLTTLGEQLTQTADIIGAVIVLLSPLWVRQGVYSPKTVEGLTSQAARTGVGDLDTLRHTEN